MEELKTKTFELEEVMNETNSYAVKNYEDLLEEVQRVHDSTMLVDKINDDVEFSIVKKQRTAIRKAQKKISERRLQVVQLMSVQYKNLENLLKEADDHLKIKVDEFEGKVSVPVYKLTLSSQNYQTLLNIKQILESENHTDLTIRIDELKGE